MITPEQVQKMSSTPTVKNMELERIQILLDEALIRIELFITGFLFDEADRTLQLAHFRLTEALALTDNEEALGADARGIVSESDSGYAYQRQLSKVSTGNQLVDGILKQWMHKQQVISRGGTGNVGAELL